MVVKSIYVLQKASINFNQPQFQTGPTKIQKNHENTQNCIISGSKTPKNDLLTLNYGLTHTTPSSFTTLSTCRTTKRG